MKHFCTPLTSQYAFHLTGEISHETPHVEEFVNILTSEVTSDDDVVIYIDSTGGDLDVAQRMIGAIGDCPAHVRAVVSSSAESAAAIIALACNSIELRPFAELMLHPSSIHGGGELRNMRKFAENQERAYMRTLESHCMPFLVQNEIDDIIKGAELRFLASDIDTQERLNRHNKKSEDVQDTSV